MRVFFAVALAWTSAETLTIASLASREFASYDRLWFPICTIMSIWLIAGLRGLYLWPKGDADSLQLMLAPWAGVPANTVHQFFILGFFAMLILSPLSLVQAFLAEESASACGNGASSCSSEEGISGIIYNPRGFFDATKSFNDAKATLCTYSSCSWPSSNGLGIIGYNASSTQRGYADYRAPGGPLATNRRSDYPDASVGLSNGFFLGFATPVSNIALCPGSYIDGSTSAVVGRGVCSYCSAYFRKHRGLVDPATLYCPAADEYAADDAFWCSGICPRLLEKSDAATMMRQFLYVVVVASSPLRLWGMVFAAAAITSSTR